MNRQMIIEPLNPADYFTLAMDEEIRRDGMPGSYACFGLTLDCAPDPEVLQQRIDEFFMRFPGAGASLQQIGKRFYWCRREQTPPLFFQHRNLDQRDDADFQQSVIDTLLNQREPRTETAPICFHLISGQHSHTFLMRWLHPFCDARGADLIIRFLCTDDAAARRQFGADNHSLVNRQLAKYPWWQKIALFVKAKRYIARIDHYRSILPFNVTESPRHLHTYTARLTPEQTAEVSKQARLAVGLTGTSLYYIGCFMRALAVVAPEAEGDAYCTPYAFNLRKQRALEPMTGNHLSALFAQAPKTVVQNRSLLFQHLKEQNAQAIRQRLDYAFLPLMWAGSWLTLDRYGKILRQSSINQQERSSFWFSDIGSLDLNRQQLAGANIEQVFHSVQVTTPPGLAFLCCIFNRQLTLSYSFVEPGYDQARIQQLHQQVMAELLARTT